MAKLTSRQTLVIVHDVAATAVATVASFWLRFDTPGLEERLDALLWFLPGFLFYAAGIYQLSGRPVVSDGRVVRLEDGTLAGSAATMPDLIRLMARLPGMSLHRSIGLASAVPAKVLGERGLGRVAAGACADLVVMDAQFRVRLTMVRGMVKFRRSAL